MNRIKIAPTLACSDLMNVGKEIRILDKCNVDTYHIDIMDGNFVPNYCLSWDFIRALKAVTDTPIDIHLMTCNLDRDIETAIKMNVDGIAFHMEAAVEEVGNYLRRIRKEKTKAGLAISPETPVESIRKYLIDVDYILLMGVTPGFSGQQFIDKTFERISRLSDIRSLYKLEYEIYVDGGITNDIARECMNRGADIIVAGMPTIYRERGRLEELTQELQLFLDRRN